MGAIAVIATVGVVAAIRSNNSAQTAVPGAANPINSPRPQPPGPAPAGKVWSVEHGHWHDAPAGGSAAQPAATPVTTTQPQPGPAPEGKVWSPEHGHWHDAPKK